MELLKYQEIESYLMEELSCGKYSIGDRFPSETELAARFHVNALTIRKAYGKLVESGYVVRKRRTGTFVRTLPEKPIKPRLFQYCLIGVILGRNLTSDIKIAMIMLALQQAIERHGYMMVVVHDKPEALFDAGIIGAVSVAEISPKWRTVFREHHIPLVEFGSSSTGKYHIRPDFSMGAEFAVKAFSNAGCKRMAVVGSGQEAMTTFGFFMPHLKRLSEKSGMDVIPCAFEKKEDFSKELHRIFSGRNSPDALFVLNSWCLDTVSAVLRECGKIPGKDVSVLVHGSNALLVPATPSWSILDIDVDRAANTLVEILHRLILNRDEEIEQPLSPYLPILDRGSMFPGSVKVL